MVVDRYWLRDNQKFLKNSNGKFLGNSNVGYGGRFDGVNDYFILPSQSTDFIETNSDFTINILFAKTINHSVSPILHFTNRIGIAYVNSTTLFVTCDNGFNNFWIYSFTYPSSFALNQIHHLILTCKKGVLGGLQLYIDGILIGSQNPTNHPLVTGVGINGTVGVRSFNSYGFLSAIIYDLKIFDKALLPTEIDYMTTYKKIPPTALANIKLDLKMDSLYKQGADWYTPDASGNGYHAQLVGYPNGSVPLVDLNGTPITQYTIS